MRDLVKVDAARSDVSSSGPDATDATRVAVPANPHPSPRAADAGCVKEMRRDATPRDAQAEAFVELEDVTPQQIRAAALLAQGLGISDVARAVGVHRSTVHRWLEDVPGFSLYVRRRAEISSQEVAAHMRKVVLKSLTKASRALDGSLDGWDVMMKVLGNRRLLELGLLAPPEDDPSKAEASTRAAKS